MDSTPAVYSRPALPPVLLEAAPAAIRGRIASFYDNVPAMFHSWVARRQSPHTQRAYRNDVLAFVAFLQIR